VGGSNEKCSADQVVKTRGGENISVIPCSGSKIFSFFFLLIFSPCGYERELGDCWMKVDKWWGGRGKDMLYSAYRHLHSSN
jgi:hypothetical protein